MDHTNEPSQSDNGVPVSESTESSGKFLSWPPPGLEALQGRLWPAITLIATGDVVLIVPLLLLAAVEHEVWSFGTFGDSWWIPLLTTIVGLIVLFAGLARLFSLLRMAVRAGHQDHGWLIVLLLAADHPRDTGFLMQGARVYSDLAPGKRKIMLIGRVVAVRAQLIAALWIPLGFVLSVMLGARGVIGPSTVWYVTLAPAGLLFLVGIASRFLRRRPAWSALRDRGLRAAVEQEVRGLVKSWNAESSRTRGELGFAGAVGGKANWFRGGAICVVLLALFIVVPLITVALSGAVGSVFTAIAIPSYDQIQARVAVAEIMRPLKLEADGTVGAEEAGDALHSLLSATADSVRPFERAPVRSYRQEWFPEVEDSVIQDGTDEWVLGLFEMAGRGLAQVEVDYLASVASHPAHSEFRRVAMADSIDIIGTRYRLPFPDSITAFSLPIPRFISSKQAVDAHVALAAFELSRGNRRAAEKTLRELLSVGFALIDEGLSVMDVLMGAMMVKGAAEALEQFYGAVGQTRDAENIMWMRKGMEEAFDRTAVTSAGFDPEGTMRAMPDAVLGEQISRGIRWEYFLTFNTFAPCANLNKVVFRPGEDYQQWLSVAEQALVRRPSDEEMFRFLERGWFRSSVMAEIPFWLRAALQITYGGRRPGSCAAQLIGLEMVGAVH